MDNPMTPRLVELVRRLREAHELARKRGGDMMTLGEGYPVMIEAADAISRLMAEGGLSKEPLRPLGPEVMQLVIDLREYAEEARTSGNGLADVPNRLLSDAAEMLSITEYGYRKVCEKNDELQALCSALLQASEGCGSSNPVDDGAVERGAKALAKLEGAKWNAKDCGETMAGNSPDEQRQGYRDMARAALEAAEPHP